MKALEKDGELTIHAVAAFRLLLLTGCRSSEIQKLKWDYVYLEEHELRLPDSKTGAKTVYLGKAAVSILEKLPRVKNNPYVIVGHIDGHHLNDMQKPWRRIRKAAGLEDVRIHDLRHTFASGGLLVGEGLPMIGKLLGHSQVQTTAATRTLQPIQSNRQRQGFLRNWQRRWCECYRRNLSLQSWTRRIPRRIKLRAPSLSHLTS